MGVCWCRAEHQTGREWSLQTGEVTDKGVVRDQGAYLALELRILGIM